MSGLEIRKLAPASKRSWRAPPEWDIWLDDVRIGHVRQWTRGSIFYDATVFHPDYRDPIRVESSTDFDERVQKIIEVARDPEAFINRRRGLTPLS